MNRIDIFYQGEGLGEVQHFEIETNVSLAVLKGHLCRKHSFVPDILLFLEDEDSPLDEASLIQECVRPAGMKLHLHRCRHVNVTVRFNGESTEHHFAPSATVASVKRWAASKFGLSAEEVGEHVLQITGTHDRPSPGVHIGAIAACSACRIGFDLVPDERVNGFAEGGV